MSLSDPSLHVGVVGGETEKYKHVSLPMETGWWSHEKKKQVRGPYNVVRGTTHTHFALNVEGAMRVRPIFCLTAFCSASTTKKHPAGASPEESAPAQARAWDVPFSARQPAAGDN